MLTLLQPVCILACAVAGACGMYSATHVYQPAWIIMALSLLYVPPTRYAGVLVGIMHLLRGVVWKTWQDVMLSLLAMYVCMYVSNMEYRDEEHETTVSVTAPDWDNDVLQGHAVTRGSVRVRVRRVRQDYMTHIDRTGMHNRISVHRIPGWDVTNIARRANCICNYLQRHCVTLDRAQLQPLLLVYLNQPYVAVELTLPKRGCTGYIDFLTQV